MAWRTRVRNSPHEYCCIGCDQKISDHETIFETRAMRYERGAAVDEAYMPLAEHPQLSAQGNESHLIITLTLTPPVFSIY